MSIRIEPLQTKVLTRLKAIYIALEKNEDHAYLQSVSDKKKEGDIIVFVAIAEDTGERKDVGYVIYNHHPKYALYKMLQIPEIQDLNVIRAYRKRGIGRALIETCEAQAISDSYTQIGIGVGLHSGYGAAQRLYAKMNYIPDGTGVTYDRKSIAPHEFRPIDDSLSLMMVKSLT